jgi:peptidoglycan/xylan/chitin deacetylase (PgdA/CDA1 family)
MAILLGTMWFEVTPVHAATNTVVSLTFDDGSASQYSTLSMLSAHGMNGTYYINSGLVGSSSYYMTWPQLHDLYNAGNDVGGHTVDHADLTKLSTANATAEVCNDRTSLINNGFSPVTSFAYPYAAVNTSAKQIVKQCGYSSGRTVGDINSINACTSCPYAETIPPQDPYYLRTPENATTSTTLSTLETYVTNAETHGGGWVILVFHGICDNRCTDTNSLSPSIFTALLDWLQPRSANGTVVRTVDQVMNGTSPPPPGPDTTPPATAITCNSAACSTGWYNTVPVTIALSATDTGGSGVAQTRYTLDGSDPSASATAITYTSAFTVSQTTTVRFYSTDLAGNAEPPRTQLVQIDAAAPAVSLSAMPATVKRGGNVTLSANDPTDSGTGSGAPSGVARVVFLLDGTTTVATVTSAPYQFTWNTRKASFGSHTLTAVATDKAGNSATSAPVTVTITK